MTDRQVIVDGLDVRLEYARLLCLAAFDGAEMVQKPPTLTITTYRKRMKTYATARGGYRVKFNNQPGLDRFDVMEVLVHELSHIWFQRSEAKQRAELMKQRAITGRSMFGVVRQEAHGPRFWALNHKAFLEAYGSENLRLAPRTNRYHGRYADALRQRSMMQVAATSVESINDLVDENERIMNEMPVGLRLPEPLASFEEMPEPKMAPPVVERGGMRLLPEGPAGQPLPLDQRVITRGVRNVADRDRSVAQELGAAGAMHIDELAARLHITNGQIRHATARMRRQGWIVKVSTGTWSLTYEGHRHFGV